MNSAAGEPKGQEGGGRGRVPRAGKAAIPPVFPQRLFHLLHVDDNTDDQVLFQAACRHAGLPIQWHVAETAARGISYLQNLVDLSRSRPVQWPDLIVLDVVMPLEDGLMVLKYVRTTPELKELKVVIWTGAAAPGFEEEARLLGATAFLRKLFGFEETVQLVKEIYGRWLAEA